MPSKTELLLPDVMKGVDAALDSYLKGIETPLNDIAAKMEGFVDKLMPEKTPWLDWMFYALGAEDYLRDDFDNAKKRAVLKRLFEIYTNKGTTQGLRLNWELLSETPMLWADQRPDKSFCGISLSAAQRRQFEAMHPEIRIYPFRNKGTEQSLYAGRCIAKRAKSMPAMTEALLRSGDYVELFDPATETAQAVNTFHITKEHVLRQARGIAEIRLKGQARGIFMSCSQAKHTVDHQACSRLYMLELYEPYSDEITRRIPLSAKPSLIPFRTTYEMTCSAGRAQGIFLTNRYSDVYKDKGGSFIAGNIVRSDADMRIVKRTRLFDPQRAAFGKRMPISCIGAMKLGSIRPNYLETAADMSYYTGSAQRRHYLVCGTAGQRIDRMLWAGRLSRQAGCKASVSITNRFVIKCSSGNLCGRHKAGQYI